MRLDLREDPMESHTRGSMTKQDAIERLVALIIQHLTVGPDRARYLAERIYIEVLAVAVEEDLTEFIINSRGDRLN